MSFTNRRFAYHDFLHVPFSVTRSVTDTRGGVNFIWEYANEAMYRMTLEPMNSLVGSAMSLRRPHLMLSRLYEIWMEVLKTGIPRVLEGWFTFDRVERYCRLSVAKYKCGIASTFTEVAPPAWLAKLGLRGNAELRETLYREVEGQRLEVIDVRCRELPQMDAPTKGDLLAFEAQGILCEGGFFPLEVTRGDRGIDLHALVKDDCGKPTSDMIMLQLKNGESHLKTRDSDGAEFFRIDTKEHLRIWQGQLFPVYLIVMNNRREIRWMEIGEPLREMSEGGTKWVPRIQFEGQPFTPETVDAVRRERLKLLGISS